VKKRITFPLVLALLGLVLGLTGLAAYVFLRLRLSDVEARYQGAPTTKAVTYLVDPNSVNPAGRHRPAHPRDPISVTMNEWDPSGDARKQRIAGEKEAIEQLYLPMAYGGMAGGGVLALLGGILVISPRIKRRSRTAPGEPVAGAKDVLRGVQGNPAAPGGVVGDEGREPASDRGIRLPENPR
jgi:hypothetical protein